jgi:hypothetical protein
MHRLKNEIKRYGHAQSLHHDVDTIERPRNISGLARIADERFALRAIVYGSATAARKGSNMMVAGDRQAADCLAYTLACADYENTCHLYTLRCAHFHAWACLIVCSVSLGYAAPNGRGLSFVSKRVRGGKH